MDLDRVGYAKWINYAHFAARYSGFQNHLRLAILSCK